jgi:hypothetical protein
MDSPIAGFRGIVQRVGSLQVFYPVNSPEAFGAHFPATRSIVAGPAETREGRIAAAAHLAGATRDQLRHQIDSTMALSTDRAAARCTAEVLLCLRRVDA